MIIGNVEVSGRDSAYNSIGNSYAKPLTPTQATKVGKSLIAKGLNSGEPNFLTGITVSFDVTASIKWWLEAERYHWFQIVMSESTMHSIDTLATRDDAFVGYTAIPIRNIIKGMIDMYHAEQDPAIKQELKLQLLYSCPVGLQLKARVTTNALQLMTIITQRENHILPEWQYFCKVFKTILEDNNV